MENNVPRQLEPGDIIQCPINVGNVTVTDHKTEIGEILYQEPWAWRESYYIEFKDTNGGYHFWVQAQDGGKAILKEEYRDIMKGSVDEDRGL